MKENTRQLPCEIPESKGVQYSKIKVLKQKKLVVRWCVEGPEIPLERSEFSRCTAWLGGEEKNGTISLVTQFKRRDGPALQKRRPKLMRWEVWDDYSVGTRLWIQKSQEGAQERKWREHIGVVVGCQSLGKNIGSLSQSTRKWWEEFQGTAVAIWFNIRWESHRVDGVWTKGEIYSPLLSQIEGGVEIWKRARRKICAILTGGDIM